jgi:hypothetical protein
LQVEFQTKKAALMSPIRAKLTVSHTGNPPKRKSAAGVEERLDRYLA